MKIRMEWMGTCLTDGQGIERRKSRNFRSRAKLRKKCRPPSTHALPDRVCQSDKLHCLRLNAIQMYPCRCVCVCVCWHRQTGHFRFEHSDGSKTEKMDVSSIFVFGFSVCLPEEPFNSRMNRMPGSLSVCVSFILASLLPWSLSFCQVNDSQTSLKRMAEKKKQPNHPKNSERL